MELNSAITCGTPGANMDDARVLEEKRLTIDRMRVPYWELSTLS